VKRHCISPELSDNTLSQVGITRLTSVMWLLLLLGCGANKVLNLPSSTSIHGMVTVKQQPVANSQVQLFSVAAQGGAVNAKIGEPVQTDSTGSFVLTDLSACPSEDALVYVVARGGEPESLKGVENPSLALMSTLGTCGELTSATYSNVNELTTIASASPLAPYAKSESFQPSSGTNLPSIAGATLGFVNPVTGTAPGAGADSNTVEKINTLGNMLVACATSSGGNAGDGSSCGQLFSLAGNPSGTPPADTLAAVISIAQNPTHNVQSLYSLSLSATAFQPALSTQPADLSITSQASLQIRVAPGSVTVGSSATQAFTATVVNSNDPAVTWTISPAVGSISQSGLYTAPATIGSAQNVTVTAHSMEDSTKTATAEISLVPTVCITVVPQGSTILLPSATTSFTATVSNSTNTAVTWSISPAIGSITATGLYTAPEKITSSQAVTVTAQSLADPTKTANAVVMLTPPSGSANTYYVDRINGQDSNSGTSPAQALATIAKVNTLPLQPGETIAFAAGEEWHETLKLTNSGTATAPITLTSYGVGAQPIISAADNVSGWTRATRIFGTPQMPTGNYRSRSSPFLWRRAQASNPYIVNFAGQPGTLVSSAAAISKAGQFAWDGATLSVYSLTNPASSVEVPQRSWPLILSGASFITVNNIELRGAQSSNIYCTTSVGCPGLVVNQVTSRSAYTDGLEASSDVSSAPGNITVINSNFNGLGGAAVTLTGSMASGATIGKLNNGNTITNVCNIYTGQVTTIGTYWTNDNIYCDAIKTYSDYNTDGTGTSIAYNNVSNVGVGQPQSYGGGIHFDTTTGGVIEHNTIQNTNGPGLQLEKTIGGALAQYNLIVNGGTATYSAGIFLRAGDGENTSGATVQYNTAYGGWWACAFLVQQNEGPATASNTTFGKNICYGGTSNTNLYADAGASGSGNTWPDNNFGIANPYFIVFGGDVLSSYSGFNGVVGQVTGSVQGNPMFNNPSAGNFTLNPNSPAIGIGAFPTP
jgi:hypothetical protein